jgi:hypothetical protein
MAIFVRKKPTSFAAAAASDRISKLMPTQFGERY